MAENGSSSAKIDSVELSSEIGNKFSVVIHFQEGSPITGADGIASVVSQIRHQSNTAGINDHANNQVKWNHLSYEQTEALLTAVAPHCVEEKCLHVAGQSAQLDELKETFSKFRSDPVLMDLGEVMRRAEVNASIIEL